MCPLLRYLHAIAPGAMAEMWGKVREWKMYFEKYSVPLEQIDKVASAFRHIDDVSAPALRRLLPCRRKQPKSRKTRAGRLTSSKAFRRAPAG